MRSFIIIIILSIFRFSAVAQQTIEYKHFEFTWYVYEMPDMKYEKIHHLFDFTKDLSQQGGALSNLRKGGVITKEEGDLFAECFALMNEPENEVKKYTETYYYITIKKVTTTRKGQTTTSFYVETPQDAKIIEESGSRFLCYEKITNLGENEPFRATTQIIPQKDTIKPNGFITTTSISQRPEPLIWTSSALIHFFIADTSASNLSSSSNVITFHLTLNHPQKVHYYPVLGVRSSYNHYSKEHNAPEPYRSFHYVQGDTTLNQKPRLRILLSSASKTFTEINEYVYPNYLIRE